MCQFLWQLRRRRATDGQSQVPEHQETGREKLLNPMSQEPSYDPETVRDKVQTRIETRFRFRIQKPEFPVSGCRLPVSGFQFRLGSRAAARCLGGFRFPVFHHFSPFFPNLHHFSPFFPIYHIYHIYLHFSPFFPHFSPLFPIYPHFSSFSQFFFIFPIFPHFRFRFPVSAGGPLLPLVALAASGFRFRLGVSCCRSLPWRLPVSGFSSFFQILRHFSSFFIIFHHFSTFSTIFPHFSTFFLIFTFSPIVPHFSPFFTIFHHLFHFLPFFVIFPHFSPFPLPVSGFRFRLGVPCCRSWPWAASGFRFPVFRFRFGPCQKQSPGHYSKNPGQASGDLLHCTGVQAPGDLSHKVPEQVQLSQGGLSGDPSPTHTLSWWSNLQLSQKREHLMTRGRALKKSQPIFLISQKGPIDQTASQLAAQCFFFQKKSQRSEL